VENALELNIDFKTRQKKLQLCSQLFEEISLLAAKLELVLLIPIG